MHVNIINKPKHDKVAFVLVAVLVIVDGGIGIYSLTYIVNQ